MPALFTFGGFLASAPSAATFWTWRARDFEDLGVGGRGSSAAPGSAAIGTRGQPRARRRRGGRDRDGSPAGRTLLVRERRAQAGGAAGARGSGGSSPGRSPARADRASEPARATRAPETLPLPPPLWDPGRGRGRGTGSAGAALTMSYTLSTTNWLAPILLPAAASSSSRRSAPRGGGRSLPRGRLPGLRRALSVQPRWPQPGRKHRAAGAAPRAPPTGA